MVSREPKDNYVLKTGGREADMTDGPARARRNDPGMQAIAGDPEVAAILDEKRQERSAPNDVLAQAIAATDNRTLKGWVTVAMWEDESGRVSQTVMCDDNSSPLEIKGYLHDAVWATAHAE